MPIEVASIRATQGARLRNVWSTSRSIRPTTKGLIVGVLAWVLGVPLSYLLSLGLNQALNLGTALKHIYPLSGVITGLVGMVAVTMLSSLWLSLSAGRKTVSSILRYQ